MGGDVKIKTALHGHVAVHQFICFRQFIACNLNSQKMKMNLFLNLMKKDGRQYRRARTFRDVIKNLIFWAEDAFESFSFCRYHPVPTTFARMGRFGSPFAGTDFMNVDPALQEFDKTATA